MAATKLGSKHHQQPHADDHQEELDPKYEWQENAANFLLRLHLSGFRKEDFRVQVDGAGRLTVRGQRSDATGKRVRFHKVFQLPPTSNLDDVSGRFDAGVLVLTVPKRPATPVPATTTTNKDYEEVKRNQEAEPQPREKKPQEKTKKEETQLKPNEEGRKKAAADEEMIKADVLGAKPEQQEHETAAAMSKDNKDEAPNKPKADTKVVDRDSLLDTVVRRRAEEEKANKAAAAEEAERQRTTCGGWKERVAEELQELTASEWVETAKRNKELIAAAAVAAFSLGLFVSNRLFSRN